MKRPNSTAIIARTLALNAVLSTLTFGSMEPRDDGAFVHDRIVQANASLFTEAYFSEALTGFAMGWKDVEPILETLEFFAPQVLVPRRFDYAEFANAEEFYSEDNDARAIGADFGIVEYTQSEIEAKTINRGLKICVDLDQVADKEGWREHYAQKLMRRLQRNSLRRAIALLSAAATNTAKTWDATAGKDPDGDITADLITAADAAGVRPNRVGFGDTSWNKRYTSHRAQNTAGGFASAQLTPEQLASILMVDEVKVSKEHYSTGGTKSQAVGNLVLMFNASAGQDKEDASNIKRFVSPCEGGTVYRVYEQQISEKLYVITVECYELTKITSTLGIRKFTVS